MLWHTKINNCWNNNYICDQKTEKKKNIRKLTICKNIHKNNKRRDYTVHLIPQSSCECCCLTEDKESTVKIGHVWSCVQWPLTFHDSSSFGTVKTEKTCLLYKVHKSMVACISHWWCKEMDRLEKKKTFCIVTSVSYSRSFSTDSTGPWVFKGAISQSIFIPNGPGALVLLCN